MAYLDDTAIALSISLILFAVALSLPSINITFPFELHFGADLPGGVLTVFRLGIIGLAVAIGSKPLSQSNGGVS